jgi:excisionase family DNA binding protein
VSLDDTIRSIVREEFATAVAQMNDPLQPASFDLDGAARMLSVSRKMVEQLIRTGHLEAVRYESMTERRVTRAAIDAFLARAAVVEPGERLKAAS